MSYRKLFQWIIVGIFLIVILSFSSNTVNAIKADQEKFALKKCEYSFNDPDFNSWNEDTGEGVFLEVTNDNLNIGRGKEGDYSFEVFQDEREYYNNFGSYNPDGDWPYNQTSNIPILQVDEESDTVYVNCSFKVGDYRIYPRSIYFLYLRNAKGGELTTDFNLSRGLIDENADGYGFLPKNYIRTQFEGNKNPASRYYKTGEITYSTNDSVYYFDNEYIDNPEDVSPSDWRDGFYPNTNPNVKYKAQVGDLPSAIYHFRSAVTEANSDTSFAYLKYFYINSSINDVRDFLVPIVKDSSKFTNKETGDSVSVSENGYENGIDVSEGDNIKVEYDLYNPFNIDLGEREFRVDLHENGHRTGGLMGRAKSDKYYETINSFQSKNSKKISSSFELDGKSPQLLSFLITFTEGDHFGRWWTGVGSDNTKYLGFMGLDPKIQFTSQGAVFNMTTDLFVPRYYGNKNIEINPGEYKLLYELYRKKENSVDKKVDDFEVVLDDERFNKMGINSIEEQERIPFSKIFEIKDSYEQGEYYVKVFSIPISEDNRYEGEKVSTLNVEPEFESKFLIYPVEETEVVYGTDVKSNDIFVDVFNPTFYNQEINVSIKNLNNANYSYSEPKTINLKPLGDKRISFEINATHDPWPSNEIERTFELNAEMSGEDLSSNIGYDLFVYSENIERVDLIAENIDLDCDDCLIDSSFDITNSWRSEVSESNSALGSEYNSSLEIKNSSGDVVKNFKKEFSLNNDPDIGWDIENIDISDSGDYEAHLIIDSEDSINEGYTDDDNFHELEDNNNFSSTFKVIEHGSDEDCDSFSGFRGCLNDSDHI
ncbi:MAG: hypothetical protein ACOCP4_06400, partial [Candidatus Woesearchaeota archaeon]